MQKHGECQLRIIPIADFGLRIADWKTDKMNASDIQQRTKAFALRVIQLVERLPQNRAAGVIGNQLLRCGTSVGANYRAACRARSAADFIAKLGIVEEEADEATYWLELLVEAGLIGKNDVADLVEEAHQLLAITVSSIKTARKGVH